MDLRVIIISVAFSIVQCELINISCNDTKKNVDGHNIRRLQLAKGEVPNQPAASKMNYVVWDEELAIRARNWAARNWTGREIVHNSNTKLPSGRSTVENINWIGMQAKNPVFDADLTLQDWWREHENYKYTPLTLNDFDKSSPQIGHYTQMAWASTTRIGCGVSKYRDGKWFYIIVVCNYSPAGNVIGARPYDSDQGASGRLECGESDCTIMYGDQCRLSPLVDFFGHFFLSFVVALLLFFIIYISIKIWSSRILCRCPEFLKKT